MEEGPRDRRITLAVVAVWLCAAVMAIGAIAAVVVLARGGEEDIVAMGLVDSAEPRPGLDPVLGDLPLGNRLLFAVGPLVTGISWVLAAALVQRVLRAVGASRPFDDDAVQRLPRAALALGIGALATLAADVVATTALVVSPRTDELFRSVVSSGFEFPGTTFACAVVIGALAVAFRRGATLERELAGLV